MNHRKLRHLKKHKVFMHPQGEWALFDTEDKLWMGGDKGPHRYIDEGIAKLAARLIEARLCWPAGRIRAREFTTANTKHDTLTYQRSVERAFQLLEDGRIL